MQSRDRIPSPIHFSLLATLALTSLPSVVQAQVIPDNTLGPGNNSVTSTLGNRTDITGGLRRSSSLFHSFSQFNVNTLQQVYFANPAGIRNIFSRVTGGNLSTIDGTLGVAGAANLFLMNPSGIIFGPNARLDISGSFFATTADALEFPDGQRFAATGDRAVPLVEVNIPIGIQFGANPPAMLTNRGILATGQDLTLAAGNLDLQGQLLAGRNLTLNATDTVRIRDTVTEPFLARSGGNMTIQGNQGIDILALNHLSQTPLVSGGDMRLVSDGIISGDAHYETGGNFSILTTTGGTGDFFSIYDPIITANGNVSFGVYTGASLQVTAAGSITTGAITINAIDAAIDPNNPVLTLRAGVNNTNNNQTFPFTEPTSGTTFTNTTPVAPQPGITVNGNISTTLTQPFKVTLTAPGDISTRDIVATSSAISDYARIELTSTAGSVNLNDALISASHTNSNELGGAGDIFINAAIAINIRNGSRIESNGDFGRIFLNADQALTIDKSSLSAINSLSAVTPPATGTGGLISINVGNATNPGTITITESSLRTPSSNLAPGGRINIATNNGGTINLTSSLVDSNISGTGNPSTGVNLNAPNGTVTLNTNSLVTTATSGTLATVSGNPIQVTANTVTLNDTSALSATTSNNAPGGTISVNAANSLTVRDSSLISTNVQGGASGAGGNITIDTSTLNLQTGGRIEARTLGNGRAGDIQLNVANSTTISGFDTRSQLYSGISTDTRSGLTTGIGGNITFNGPGNLIGDLNIRDGGFLSARTSGAAAGGNIAIFINNLNVSEDPVAGVGGGGQILATSSGSGAAGSITVNAAGKVDISGSRITPTPPNSPFVNPTFTVISLDGRIPLTGNSPFVEASGTLPYFSIQRNPDNAPGTIFAAPAASNSAAGGTNLGAGNNNFDYYSFSISQDGSRAIFDVDNAVSVGAAGSTFVDTELFLFDALTGQLLAANDDFFPADNPEGSTSSLDSRLTYNFNQAGTYVLGVGRYNSTASSGNPITTVPGFTPMDGNSAYRLQISLQNQGATNVSLADRNPNQGLNSGLFAQTTGFGQGGSVTVQSSSLSLRNNAEINATTVGDARGGSIAITATNTSGLPVSTPILQIEQGTIAAGVVRSDKNTFGSGEGGNITLTANNGSIAMNNLALVNASTTGRGAGGSVAVATTGGGSVAMTNGSRIEAQSQSEAPAGTITVNAPDITIAGSAIWGNEPLYSGLYVSSENQNTAQNPNPNSITINSAANPGQRLVVADGAVLSTLNRSVNPGGNISVNVTDIQLLNGGQIVTAAENTGGAGDITLNTTSLTIAGTSSFTGRQNVATGNGLVPEVEANDSLAGAQAIGNNFSLSPDPNIGSSVIIPHVTITGTGNGTFDYYAINVTTGNRAIFDIDGSTGNNNTADPGAIDSELFLFDSAGNVLAQNDDFRTTAGGQGSSPNLATGGIFDSYIEYTFQNPGTYFIGVARFNAEAQTGGIISPSGLLQAGNTYTLQVSIDQRNTRNANQGVSSGLFAQSTGIGGSAGDITVNMPGNGQVTLNDGAQISGSTVSGQGGSIRLNGLDTLQVDSSLIATSTTGNNGSAGAIAINAASSVQISGVLPDGILPTGTPPTGGLAATADNGNGSAGLVSINTSQLTIENGAAIAASTDSGIGNNITFSGLNTLQLDNGSISASTRTGEAGNLYVNLDGTALDAITLSNDSSLFLGATTPGGPGTAGDILLNARRLTVQGNSSIVAGTAGSGTAGNLTVNANGGTADAIILSGGSFLALGSTGSGNAGNVLLDTRQLTLDNATIAASTVSGIGGGITLRGLNTLALNNGQIFAETETGQAGNLTITASNQVILDNNSTLSVAATAGGTAGNLTINAGDRVRINNSEVTVSSPTGTAGNLSLRTNDLRMNRGTIEANTGGGNGANITINVGQGLLIMRFQSLISANAGSQANGGNITINAPFIVGLSFENSDITANAVQGRGGNIDITTNGIFGLQFRPRLTPLSDITASSEFGVSGNVVLNTLNIEPTRGLTPPPILFTDVSQVVGNACDAVGARAGTASELRLTGRGGVPTSPTAPLATQAPGSDWVSLELSPQVPIGVKMPDGTTTTLEPGLVYELQATCVRRWQDQQRSRL